MSYCSKACQKADWKKHKEICEPEAQLRAALRKQVIEEAAVALRSENDEKKLKQELTILNLVHLLGERHQPTDMPQEIKNAKHAFNLTGHLNWTTIDGELVVLDFVDLITFSDVEIVGRNEYGQKEVFKSPHGKKWIWQSIVSSIAKEKESKMPFSQV